MGSLLARSDHALRREKPLWPVRIVKCRLRLCKLDALAGCPRLSGRRYVRVPGHQNKTDDRSTTIAQTMKPMMRAFLCSKSWPLRSERMEAAQMSPTRGIRTAWTTLWQTTPHSTPPVCGRSRTETGSLTREGCVLYYLFFADPANNRGPHVMPVRSQKTTLLTPQTVERRWHHIDASGQVLGRLATRIATILMGKHRPDYTPHVDSGDFVVVTNCEKIRVTGKKLTQTTYDRYSHYPGGLKRIPRIRLHERRPQQLLELAVKRMLPKNALARHMFKKLKAYRGPDHPHQAQQPEPLTL